MVNDVFLCGGLWGLISVAIMLAWQLSERGGSAHPREHVVGLGAKQTFHLHRLAGRIDFCADVLNHSGIPESRFINGVLYGGLYGLLGVGLALSVGVMRVVNLSHGEFIVLSAFIGVSLI